jgi:hypothetical protein
MHRFRTSEIFLGCFLTVAVFAAGMLFIRQEQPTSPTQQVSSTKPADQTDQAKAPDTDLTGSTWLTKDAAGFFTFALVWVGGIQAWFFWVQLRLIRASLADAKTAADAAERAAKATEDAVDLSRQTSERQLRAYVHTIGKDFLVQGVDAERFTNRFSVVNAGQTPAYKLQIDSVVQVLPRPLPEHFGFAFVPEGQNRSVMMVAPGRSVGHDSLADTVLSDEEMTRIMTTNSGIRLYSYGTIRYEDCFGHPRWTDFCYFLEWEVTPQGYTFAVHPTEQHNDAN